MKYKLYIGRYIFVKADRMSLSKINVYMAAYNLKSVLDVGPPTCPLTGSSASVTNEAPHDSV